MAVRWIILHPFTVSGPWNPVSHPMMWDGKRDH